MGLPWVASFNTGAVVPEFAASALDVLPVLEGKRLTVVPLVPLAVMRGLPIWPLCTVNLGGAVVKLAATRLFGFTNFPLPPAPVGAGTNSDGNCLTRVSLMPSLVST
jgi:hypothetical protein